MGAHHREGDIEINVCKEKKLTNVRSATSDIAKRLNATVRLSLEDTLAFIADDELVEVTPRSLRLRKMGLSASARRRQRKHAARAL